MKKRCFLFIILCLPGLTSCAKQPEVFMCPAVAPLGYLNLAREQSLQAELSNDLRSKSQHARLGLQYAEFCVKQLPKQAGCLYYRAVNRGLLLQTHLFGTKPELKKMLADYEAAIRLNPEYDHGGSYLALGYVYLKAPSLPLVDIGVERDLDRAWDYSQLALSADPRSYQNHKLAGEVALQKGDHATARNHFKLALKLWLQLVQPSRHDMQMKKEIKKWLKKTRSLA